MNATITEITLPVAELKEALPGLTKIVGRSRSLPVLQSVLIHRNREGIVTLRATDLDSFVTYTAKDAQQGQPGEVLVPIDQLTKAVKCSAPKEDVGVVPESNDKVKLRYNIAGNVVEQTIGTLPVDEFPVAPQVRQPGVQLEPQFGLALKQALECRSESEGRRILEGACLDVSDKKFHYIVGTNGRTLFSANSFCFALQKSVIIPDSKFLSWSDFLDEQPAFLSVEPGKEAVEAKGGQPAQEAEAGWVKLESPRWSFITREIDGTFPNWKQCVPITNGRWTQVVLSDEAVKQLIQVIPNLPGADSHNSLIRLLVDRCLTIEGQNRGDEKWTSIPVQAVDVTGNPVSIALNRQYLLSALRFGLNKMEIEDPLSPMVLSKGGKKMVIMPVRVEESKTKVILAEATSTPSSPAPTATPTTEQLQPQPNSAAPTAERTEMPKKSKTPEVIKTDEPANTNTTNATNSPTAPSPVKSLVEQVESIKDSLRSIIRDLANVTDTVKLAEKEKRITEKEIEAVRAKLRQIQSVSI